MIRSVPWSVRFNQLRHWLQRCDARTERVLAGTLLLALAVWVGLGVHAALSREQYPGQYAQVDPETRNWFRNQISPKTKGNCCTEADGVYAEEDIRGDHYWTRFEATPPQSWQKRATNEGQWMEVPDDVIINEPNRNGAAVVWWVREQQNDGTFLMTVRCFAKGAGG